MNAAIRIVIILLAALVLASPAAAGEIARTADSTARTWTSLRTFSSTAIVCTDVWIRGQRAYASGGSLTTTTYYRAGANYRPSRIPPSDRPDDCALRGFTPPRDDPGRWEVVRRAADC